MPLVPMTAMPNQDEQLRALNYMGSYANLSPLTWNGDSGNLGFYEENGNHLSSLFSFGGSKKKKDDKDKDKKPATPAQKQPDTGKHDSGLGGMTTYLIYGSVALAGAFVIYSLMKKKKTEEPKPEVKQITKRPYRPRAKPAQLLAAQGA